MSLQHQLRAELALRAALLPEEVAAWRQQTQRDGDRWVIHRSQVAAIDLLLSALQKRQAEQLAKITPALGANEFGQRRVALESELNGAHGLAAVFRYLLSQREDADHMGRVLDLADRVAADCYLPVMELAQQWKARETDAYREPPLTYLHTAASALALTRNTTFGMVGLEIEGHSEQMLPVPLIALPYHQSAAVWTFCGIYHEVGHLLDQDFGLTAMLTPVVEGRAGSSGTPLEIWRLWMPELIADAFGVLFGGSGFVTYMARLLYLPEAELTRIAPGDRHPPGHLRMHYLAALLRATKVPALTTEADRIEATWTGLFAGTEELAPYIGACQAVAEAMLGAIQPNLKHKRLRDFVPGLDTMERQAQALAAHLAGGGPSPVGPGFPIRAIPAGAQLAVAALPEPDEDRLRSIHDTAVAFIDALPKPQPMGGALEKGLTPAHERYLNSLMKDLTFGPPGE